MMAARLTLGVLRAKCAMTVPWKGSMKAGPEIIGFDFPKPSTVTCGFVPMGEISAVFAAPLTAVDAMTTLERLGPMTQ